MEEKDFAEISASFFSFTIINVQFTSITYPKILFKANYECSRSF